MVQGYYQAVIKILKELDFQYVENSKGSHEKWRKGKTTLTVPRNLVSRHTANGILKDAGSNRHL